MLHNLSPTFLPPPDPKTTRETFLSRSQHCNHSQTLESIVVQMGVHAVHPPIQTHSCPHSALLFSRTARSAFPKWLKKSGEVVVVGGGGGEYGNDTGDNLMGRSAVVAWGLRNAGFHSSPVPGK